VRALGSHAAPAATAAPTQTKLPDGVVVPELHDTLEWLLDSPPNIHQFEEPPVSI